MKLPAYPRYKSSCVEWLGDVPEHWQVKRLDFLASVKARLGWKGLTASEYVPEGFIFLATPNIKGEGEIDFTNVNYITAERYYESPEIMLQVGDVLMAKDGSTLGTTNVVHHLPAPTTVNSSIAVLRPKQALNSSYFFRWLTSAYLQSLIQSMKDGQGVPHLFQADIRKFPVLLPEPAEQRAIAAFLDRETGRVDRLVAKKRELIERLKEKRTALISGTVTHGLPPAAARAAGLPENPPLKPTRTDWLGDIPAHWEVKKGRYVGILFGSVSPSEDEFIEDDNDQDDALPFAKVDDLNQIDGSLELTAIKTRVRGYRARPGAFLLFPKRGAAIFTNKVAIAKRPLLFDSNLMGWQVNSSFAVKFVAYCLIARRLDDLADVSTVPQINNKHIDPAPFPCPPLSEQVAIAGYLDVATAKLDALVGKVEEAVERLNEYRTALITAAVTGKIDVRSKITI